MQIIAHSASWVAASCEEPTVCPLEVAITGTPFASTTPVKVELASTSAAVNKAPPSIASEQPSPSLSKSKLLIIPSLSVSQVAVEAEEIRTLSNA